VATWRYFAERELPRVIRDLGLPAAEPVRVTRMSRCPKHQQPLGSTSRICLGCHDEAWNEVGRRYASAEQGTSRKPTDADRPPLQTFPGKKHEPLPGQLELTEGHRDNQRHYLVALKAVREREAA
jgi:hypothetical protein